MACTGFKLFLGDFSPSGNHLHCLVLDRACRSSSEGVAVRAGIQPGDAILAFNDALVKFVEQLKSLVKKPHNTITPLIQRDAMRMYCGCSVEPH